MSFPRFDMEGHASCMYDRIEVYDEGQGGPLMGEFCGEHPPENLISSSPEMLVRFVSDHDISGEGFLAEYWFMEMPSGKIYLITTY